jgi:hypothetical protein
MMEEEFYAVIKLISGEEIFSLVTPSEENGRMLLILSNPVTIETVVIKHMGMQGYKIDPWIRFADDDTFLLDMDKIVTISEVNDEDLLEMYGKFISQQNIRRNHSQLSAEMGYLSTVAEARIKFEKLYKATDKPNL